MGDKCVWPKSSLILFGNILFKYYISMVKQRTSDIVWQGDVLRGVSKMWITISLPSVGRQGVDKLCITRVLITYIMLNGMGCITNHCITYIKDYYI